MENENCSFSIVHSSLFIEFLVEWLTFHKARVKSFFYHPRALLVQPVRREAVMDSAIRKAEALIEALNYIRQFHARVIVIKLGGSAMEESEALRATLQD